MESSFMRSLLSVGVLCSANQHLFISDMMLSLNPNYHHHGRRRRWSSLSSSHVSRNSSN